VFQSPLNLDIVFSFRFTINVKCSCNNLDCYITIVVAPARQNNRNGDVSSIVIVTSVMRPQERFFNGSMETFAF